jgi:hypothetical protein
LARGPYEVISMLRAGGMMGEVYRARDAKLGRDVALKILPEHPEPHLPDLEPHITERGLEFCGHPEPEPVCLRFPRLCGPGVNRLGGRIGNAAAATRGAHSPICTLTPVWT